MKSPIKNTCPSAATLEQVEMEHKTAREAVGIPASNYTKRATARQALFVESLLNRGSENAIPALDLLNLTGISNKRLLQSIIADERAAGAVILSRSDGGYFLPADGEQGEKEIATFVHTLEARAKNTLRILRSSKRALKHAQVQPIGEI